MSDDSKGGSNEPSMEEILASIRRIIEEDAEQDGKPAAGDPPPRRAAAREDSPAAHWPEDREAESDPAPLPERTPLPDDDEATPLELTRLVNEDGSITELSEGDAPAMPFVSEEKSEHVERREEGSGSETRRYEDSPPVVQTHYEAAPGEEDRSDSELDVEDAELDDDLVAAPAAVQSAEPEESEAQLEALAENEVRAWVDRNLPDIVERVVREEVERMLRRLKDG